MAEIGQCSSCGTDLARDAAGQGLCPACLLKLGLSSTNIPPTDELSSRQLLPIKERRLKRVVLLLAIATVSALGFALGARTLWERTHAQEVRVLRFILQPTKAPRDFAISPDGHWLAFTAVDSDDDPILWIRPFDSFTDQPLAGTEGASSPFWSPDSRFVGFFSRGKLRKIDIATRIVEVLSDAPTGAHGTWSAKGAILFERNPSGGLLRVSARGGNPQPATKTDSSHGDVSHRWPSFLPDGRHFVYTSFSSNAENEGIFVASLESSDVRRIRDGRSATAYAQEFVLLIRDGVLSAQPFDTWRLRSSGDARPLRFADRVEALSVSANGVLVYQTDQGTPTARLAWLDRSGKGIDVIDGLGAFREFSLSPDSRTVAVSQFGDIWLHDLRRGVTSRFTFDSADDAFPMWSPDATKIAFLRNRGQRGLYQRAVNGAEKDELILNAPDLQSIDCWSPDARFIIYTSRDASGKSTLWTLPLGGDRKPFSVQSSINPRQARLSPDGRWLVYVSDESGRDEVYVQPFAGTDGRWQVSGNGATSPQWRHDGKEIFFISAEQVLTAVTFAASETRPELGIPHPLFRVHRDVYNVASGGQRFLIRLPETNPPPMSINVVVNWASEVER
jgi:Tol biopolymer transport system component